MVNDLYLPLLVSLDEYLICSVGLPVTCGRADREAGMMMIDGQYEKSIHCTWAEKKNAIWLLSYQ